MAELGTCGAIRYGIGANGCIKGNVIKMFRKPFLCVPGFTFDSFADFQDQDKWLEAIAAGNIYPLEDIEAVEDTSTEQSVVDTDGGNKIKTRDGKYGFIMDMNMTLDQNKIFQSYGAYGWTLMAADDADNILAQTPDETTVGGYELSYFNVYPMKPTLGADDYSKTRLEVQLQYNRQMNEEICVALGTDLDWSPMQLDPTTFVTISDVSISTFVITASFYYIQDTIASKPSKPILVLTPEDLVVIDEGGLVVTLTQPDIVMTTTEGIWEITTSAMVSGTIQEVATAASLFESAITAVTV